MVGVREPVFQGSIGSHQRVAKSANSSRPDSQLTSTSVTNAPGAENYGAEIDVLWLATDSLTIGFNYSHSHAEYDGEPARDADLCLRAVSRGVLL